MSERKQTPTPTSEAVEPVELTERWRAAAARGAKHNQQAAIALTLCADQLEAWIRQEGMNAITCMPRTYFRLIAAAHAFDENNEDDNSDLVELVEAALATQSGPS